MREPGTDEALLDYAGARRIAGQAMGYTGLSGMKTNRKGAYFFHSREFGSCLVLDGALVPDRARPWIARTGTGPRDGDPETWVLLHDLWCLAHIFCGIRIGNSTDREALATFDDCHALTAHERIAARRALAAAQ